MSNNLISRFSDKDFAAISGGQYTFKQVAELIKVNTSIKWLVTNKFVDNNIMHLKDALSHNTTLTKLSLFADLNNVSLELLVDTLNSSGNITELALSIFRGVRLEPLQYLHVNKLTLINNISRSDYSCLLLNKSLQKLSFTGVNFANINENFLQLLRMDINITKLCFDRCSFSDEYCRKLLDSLAHSEAITSVNFSRNKVTDTKELVKFLRINRTVESFNYSGVIEGEAITDIAYDVKHNTSLRKLDLRFCKVTDADFKLLLESNLQSLKISGDLITDYTPLKNNHTLSKLHINNIKFTESIRSFGNNCCLQKLIIDDIATDCLLFLIETLKHNKVLRKFHVKHAPDRNFVHNTTRIVNKFKELLEDNYTLESIPNVHTEIDEILNNPERKQLIHRCRTTKRAAH